MVLASTALTRLSSHAGRLARATRSELIAALSPDDLDLSRSSVARFGPPPRKSRSRFRPDRHMLRHSLQSPHQNDRCSSDRCCPDTQLSSLNPLLCRVPGLLRVRTGSHTFASSAQLRFDVRRHLHVPELAHVEVLGWSSGSGDSHRRNERLSRSPVSLPDRAPVSGRYLESTQIETGAFAHGE